MSQISKSSNLSNFSSLDLQTAPFCSSNFQLHYWDGLFPSGPIWGASRSQRPGLTRHPFWARLNGAPNGGHQKWDDSPSETTWVGQKCEQKHALQWWQQKSPSKWRETMLLVDSHLANQTQQEKAAETQQLLILLVINNKSSYDLAPSNDRRFKCGLFVLENCSNRFDSMGSFPKNMNMIKLLETTGTNIFLYHEYPWITSDFQTLRSFLIKLFANPGTCKLHPRPEKLSTKEKRGTQAGKLIKRINKLYVIVEALILWFWISDTDQLVFNFISFKHRLFSTSNSTSIGTTSKLRSRPCRSEVRYPRRSVHAKACVGHFLVLFNRKSGTSWCCKWWLAQTTLWKATCNTDITWSHGSTGVACGNCCEHRETSKFAMAKAYKSLVFSSLKSRSQQLSNKMKRIKAI